MELIGLFAFLLLGFYVLGVPIWLATHNAKLRDLAKQLADAKAELQDSARAHDARMAELTTRIQALEHKGVTPVATAPPPQRVEAPPVEMPAAIVIPEVVMPAPVTLPEAIMPEPVALPEPVTVPEAVMPEPAALPELVAPQESVVPPTPVFVPRPAAAPTLAASAIARSVAVEETPAAPPFVPSVVETKPFEERLVEWLTKFGAVIVFLGLAAAASYFWDDIGIWGRVAMFVAAGGGMLGGGLNLEKKDRYKVLGRSLVGGGWATLFMTTFGAYHFAAIKVVPSLELDLVLVLAVTTTMVWDTLRYNSRWVTGLAFGLGFYTVAQSHDSAWSLLANVILASGFIAVVRKRRWYDLEVVGLIASYGNHVLWLRPYVDAGTVPVLPSAIVLAGYWLAFRASYVWREIRDTSEESISSVAAVLNSALLLSVAYYQHTFSAGFGFWAILALGVTEILIARLLHVPKGEEVLLDLTETADRPRLGRSRRTAFLVLSSLGCLLVLAATPVNFVASPRILLWAVSAQAMLFAGYFTGEWLFRRFGIAAALLSAGYALATDGAQFMVGVVFAGGDRTIPVAHGLGLLFAAIAVVSYLDAHVVPVPQTGDVKSGDRAAASFISHIAWASLVVSLYLLVPEHWVAVSLGVTTCLLAFTASRFDVSELIVQAHVTMMAAVVDVVAVNGHAVSVTRIVSFAGVAAAAYVAGEFVRRYDAREHNRPVAGQLYAWLGTGTVATLIYLQTHDWRTAPAWAVLALALGVAGRYVRRLELKWQAAVVATGAFIQTITVNLPADGVFAGHVSTRLVSVPLVAGVLYMLQLYAPGIESAKGEPEIAGTSIGPAYSWAASLLASWLIWYELPPAMVSVGWAVFGLVLFEFGMTRESAGRIALRQQSCIAAIAAFAHVLIVNINQPDTLWYGAAPIVPGFFYMHERLRAADARAATPKARAFPVASMLAWLGSVTIFVILKFTLPADFVVLGWAACSTALAGAASVSGRRVFLDQAIVGVAPVVFRGVNYNIYETHLGSLGSAPGVGLVGAAAALLLALPFLMRLRDREYKGDALSRLWRRPEQVFFFAAFTLVTIVLAYLLPGVSMTVAWGIEAAVIVAFALLLGERSFRLTGLGLLVVCVAKILAYDVWHFENALSRILTLTAIGGILLGVSFLYGRLRERIRGLL